MVEIQNMLCNNLDKGKITCAVLLDLAKAFDSVNHDILLKKCENFGIRGKALLLIKSYLSSRQHLVKIGNSQSSRLVMDIRVPQRSVLGPLLFLMFINDSPKTTKINVMLFAEDTFLSLQSNYYKSLQK